MFVHISDGSGVRDLGGIQIHRYSHGFFLLCCIIGILHFCSPLISGQGELVISGPAEAVAGEVVTFTVTLDDIPVQARVLVEDSTIAYSSNATTGEVQIPLPAISSTSKTIVISATLFSGDETSTTIQVINPAKQLMLSYSPLTIKEQELFCISVSSHEGPLDDVEIQFNGQTLFTNSSGIVEFQAPDVLVTSNYGVLANKSGYETNFSTITVFENFTGVQFMDVIYPAIVEPESMFSVQCLGFQGGIADCSVAVWYEEELVSDLQTNDQGFVEITTPTVNIMNYCTLVITKNGYATYTQEDTFRVWLVEKQWDQSLTLSTDSSEIDEDEFITLRLQSSNGTPIQGATIWRGSTELLETTDPEGISIIAAPQVFLDRTLYLFCLYEGFNFGQTQITVRDTTSLQKHINIFVGSPVYEEDIFAVSIEDDHEQPLDNVLVVFQDQQQLTDQYGIVTFTAPEVATNQQYSLEASKYGYESATKTVTVENINQGNGNGDSKQLKVLSVPTVLEHTEFTITVQTLQGSAVYNAEVSFGNTKKSTNPTGKVSFTAPEVFWDCSESIIVTKSGYISASTDITIINSANFPYWSYILAVMVIFIIGFIFYYRYRIVQH